MFQLLGLRLSREAEQRKGERTANRSLPVTTAVSSSFQDPFRLPKSPDYLHRRLSKHGLLRPQRFLFPTTTCLSVHVCTANADKPDGDGVFERWSDNHPSTGGRVRRKPGHGDGVFERWGDNQPSGPRTHLPVVVLGEKLAGD